MSTIANTMLQKTPIFGKIFAVDKSTGLEDINAWPALMIMASFIWLAVAGLLGFVMPVTQLFELPSGLFYTSVTLHGAALAFPFSFQLMMGVGLHRSGGCVGKPINGWLAGMVFFTMNIGAALFTVAVLMGLKVSMVVMYPLPMIGAEMGMWSMSSVVLGFTGIYLMLACMIWFYPLILIKMLFFGEKREELILSERKVSDPGMLGMALAAFILLVSGLPLTVTGTAFMLGLYKILPMTLVGWAFEPVVFQYSFYIFAHNLMEAMAIMITSAIYATLPLYLADGSRKLFSDRLANLALWLLFVTSVTSFLHHFITLSPNQPNVLSYWGNLMSWATGLGAAISIFTIFATIWQHGLKKEPAIIAALAGWALYNLDGASAMVTSNIAWHYQLHGTVWQSGHTMTVIVSMSVGWLGILYHHYPVMSGRKLDPVLGSWFIRLFLVGGTGAALTMLAAGAAGMPKRYADWSPENWMSYGNLIFVFGLILGASFVIYLYNLMKSREITTTSFGGERTTVPA